MKGRKRNILLIGGGALLLVVIIAVNLARSGGGRTAIQASTVKRSSIEATVRAPGRIQPETQVKLSANVPGEVVRLAVKEGDVVRKGQFLLQLDDTQVRARVNEARAAIQAARSNLRLAEATLAQSEATLKRQEALFARNLVSPQEVENARTQRNADRARVDANREEIERATATLQVSEDNLRKTRFFAPIPGTVTQLAIEEGEIVVTGTMNNPGTVILTIADMKRMIVEAEVDETDVSSVALGQPATVTVDAFPDQKLRGSVLEIANSPEIAGAGTQEQQTNFQVDVLLENPPLNVRPGMTADVEIRTAKRDSVLVVPIQSVVVRTQEELKPVATKRKRGGANAEPVRADSVAKDAEIRGVFVVDKDGTVAFRPVKTGISSDTDFEVIGELKPGDQVVTGPFRVLRTLKPGTRVKIEEPKRPGAEKK